MPTFKQRPTEGRRAIERGGRTDVSTEQGYTRQRMRPPTPKPPSQWLCVVCGHRTHKKLESCPVCHLEGMIEEKP